MGSPFFAGAGVLGRGGRRYRGGGQKDQCEAAEARCDDMGPPCDDGGTRFWGLPPERG